MCSSPRPAPTCACSPPPRTSRLGQEARPAGTNQPAGSNRPKPCPATATSKPPSGWPPCQHRAAPTPTSAPASDASSVADPHPRNRAANPPPGRPPSLRSNTRCSPAPGTCLSTARSTKIPAPTTTPDTTPRKTKPGPSNNSKPSDTTSHSNPAPKPPNTSAQPTHQLLVTLNFRVSEAGKNATTKPAVTRLAGGGTG